MIHPKAFLEIHQQIVRNCLDVPPDIEVTVVLHGPHWAGPEDDSIHQNSEVIMSESAKTKKAKAKGSKKAASQDGKMSCIDAAAKVLAEKGEPMNCKEMIDAMAAKGYWTTPGGKTPWATLYSSIAREIRDKGKESRFKKAERGRFASTAPA
jgi:hypothetical protein